MGYKVVPTATFEDEYDAILHYLAVTLSSKQAARKLQAALTSARETISEFPEIKAVSTKPSLDTLRYREWPIRNYVLVYRFDGKCVFLEHIFHQSQDFETLV